MSTNILVDTSSPLPGWINNKPVLTKATFKVLDPHEPSKVLREVQDFDAEEAAHAVEAAQAALPAWKETPLAQRKEIFTRVIAIFEERLSNFTNISIRETTATSAFAAMEIGICIPRLKELVRVSDAALADEEIETEFPGQTATILREPFGVVLGIAPSNAPVTLATRAVAEAILAGNTCVLKTSEVSPVGNSIISQVFTEAGLPAGVLNVVHASAKNTPSVVESLIANPAVRKVNFTGSTRVGAIIAALAGKYLKPVTLELGGAAMLLALDDADVTEAAKNAAFGKFMHSGQICMSTNNILIHESIADEFIVALKKELVTFKVGSSANLDENNIRGVFSAAHAANVTKTVEDALSKGAKVIFGDENKAGNYQGGNIVQPTVLDGITPDMTLYAQEVFGPVMGIIRFKTDEEAIAIWNSLDYGLAGAVHSRNIDRAKKIARKLDTSLININSFTIHDSANVPHGGWKQSGFGRFNGFDGIREFTQTKTISVVIPGKNPVPSMVYKKAVHA